MRKKNSVLAVVDKEYLAQQASPEQSATSTQGYPPLHMFRQIL